MGGMAEDSVETDVDDLPGKGSDLWRRLMRPALSPVGGKKYERSVLSCLFLDRRELLDDVL